MSWLRRLLGARPRGETPAASIFVQVRCNACGEVIRARINPAAELSACDDGEGYFVRKVVVGRRCFRPIELRLRYRDLRGTLLSREATGGTFEADGG